eukprot:scaffold4779_cov116-Isochrysis_galbana.AAC.5
MRCHGGRHAEVQGGSLRQEREALLNKWPSVCRGPNIDVVARDAPGAVRGAPSLETKIGHVGENIRIRIQSTEDIETSVHI